jgi:hypothetical protein
MNRIGKFRLCVAIAVLVVGGSSICNLLAEYERPAPFPIPISRNANASPMARIVSAEQAAAIAPFRSDLKAQHALALTNQSLASQGSLQSNNNENAQSATRDAIKLGPHGADMWLALALLQAQRNIGDPQIAESLKMSYFTGPNQKDLVPSRLDIATVTNVLSDSDLKELATGDVRAILLRYPDQRQFLIGDYFRGSAVGKTFLEETVKSVDPQFLDALRKMN